MYYREFYYWCRDAVRKIRYWKDRNKVYAELYEHMMERYESLLAKGYDQEKAVKLTVEAMGSAEELAPQLAAIHRPHWAYAAILTRIIALTLACLCFGHGVEYAVEHDIWSTASVEVWDPYTQGGEECVSHVKPKDSVVCDGYTFRVEEAALWRTYYHQPTEKGEYFDVLYMRLGITHPIPWMQENVAMAGFGLMWAQDSTGARYDQIYGIRQEGVFTYRYEISIQDLQEDISWIELHYDRDGRDMVLRVDLSGGDGL